MQIVPLTAIIAFVVLAYLPSFAVPFLFDDYGNIVLNARAQPENTTDLVDALDARGARDRPVAMLTFALNYLHAGLDARWYHAVNLLIHLANSVILFVLVQLLARAPFSPRRLQENAMAFAFVVALIWAVHPVNTQAVTYIVQRMASLVTTFYLLGLLLFVLWRSGHVRGSWAGAGFALAFLAGLGTKANVVTLPLAVLLLDVAFFRRFARVHAIALAAIGAGGGVLLALYAAPQLPFLFESPPHRDFSGIERLITQSRVIWHYLSLLAWPDAGRLQLDYDFTVSRGLMDPPGTLAAIIGLLAITVLAVVFFQRARWPSAGWLFFLLALSVESSFILLELAFEHRLYLPATLLIAGVVAPLFHLAAERSVPRHLSLVAIALAGVLSWQTMVRNQQWQDAGAFWSSDLDRGASLYRSALNSGLGFLRSGDADRALAMLARIEQGDAAKTDFEKAKTAQLIGEALLHRGDALEALEAFRRALEWSPRWTRPAYFSGLALTRLDRLDDARTVLDQIREQQPGSVFSASLEAEIVRFESTPVKAVDLLQQRLDAVPRLRAVDRSFLHLHMGNLYRDANRLKEAARAYQTALEIDSDNQAARISLKRVNARLDAEQETAPAR